MRLIKKYEYKELKVLDLYFIDSEFNYKELIEYIEKYENKIIDELEIDIIKLNISIDFIGVNEYITKDANIVKVEISILNID